MATEAPERAGQTRVPGRAVLAQVGAPLRHFLQTEAGSAVLLLAATLLALGWANSPWSESYASLWGAEGTIAVGSFELSMDLRHWINDGVMVLFFFVVGLEVRRELSVGELTDRRRVVVPVLAAFGGVVIPAAIYLAINGSGEAARGWGIVIGTDTAFLLGALAIVGPACPTQLRIFLLSLTVFDDIVAVTVIGLVYSDALDPVALGVMAVCLLAIALLSRRGEWRYSVYAVTLLVLWVATEESGLHASIAGMLAGLLVAARSPHRQAVERAASLMRAFRQSPLPDVGYAARQGLQQAVSINDRLQVVLHPWTSYVVVPLFALANAGVDLRGGLLGEALGSPVTWGVVAGLVAGKLVGVGLGALGAVKAGLGPIPQGVGEGQVLGGAALSGIGFTVSLLIASLAFESPELREQATVGVLFAAVLAMATGWLVFRLAAVLRGERTASLPVILDPPVDPVADHVRGAPDAPLTLVEYSDFECPFCGRATGVTRELRRHFGDELRYVVRHLPLTDVHPHAELAARAAEAAARQGSFWEMHDLLFEHQAELELEDLVGYASDLELDVEAFMRDLRDEALSERIQRDVASAEASGVRGTPTFFVGNRRHVGAYDTATLRKALEALREP